MELIRLKNIMVKISESFRLNIPEWSLNKNENWLVSGKNGSGKSLFAKLLLGQVPFTGECVFKFQNPPEQAISWVSPDLDLEILNQELKNDDSEFMEGGFDPGRKAIDIILSNRDNSQESGPEIDALLEMFHIRHIAEKGYRFLSSGETRKVLIARALVKKPELLILENPYAGLDIDSQHTLAESLGKLIASGTQLIILGSSRMKRPENTDHILYLRNGNILINDKIKYAQQTTLWKKILETDINLPTTLPETYVSAKPLHGDTIIRMQNVSVSYNGQAVFENLNWTLRKGENWSIVGPNGSGKSTLLSMISGDNPKAYGKDLWIFGKKKGSGESIWDIKKQIGFISPDFHRRYSRVNPPLSHVIISGYYDSIGVYDPITPELEKSAEKWLELMDMKGRGNEPFKSVSFGSQRMVLLCRAMVKLPPLLILDEPCEGLDDTNRERILKLIDHIAENSKTHILHVTHDPNETLHCITHRLTFVRKDNQAYEGISETL